MKWKKMLSKHWSSRKINLELQPSTPALGASWPGRQDVSRVTVWGLNEPDFMFKHMTID